MAKTQTATKAATKPAAKAATKATQAAKPAQGEKAAPKAKVGAYAQLLARALKGDFGPAIQRFYASACVYHKAKKTVFPRARNAGRPLMKIADATAWLEARKTSGIPAGDGNGQRLFDEMMSQAA